MMNITADENIPYARELFSKLGQVHTLGGREMNAVNLANSDVLLVRSITKVDKTLLKGSKIRFVGTATIGADHIDQEYLKDSGIEFSSCAGSNANSVAEYVISCLLNLARLDRITLAGKTLGIIGVGNIGSILEKKALALDMKPLLNDPPRQRQTGNPKFLPLDNVLQADFVTCHVPLTKSGPDKTLHLLNKDNLAQMQSHAVLINSSRGPVVDNLALKAALINKQIHAAVLDVWENEPDIDLDLMDLLAIGTMHIAGYSLEGKVNGAAMLYHKVCKLLRVEPTINVYTLLPEPTVKEIHLDPSGKSHQELLTHAVNAIYDVGQDDRKLRRIKEQSSSQRSIYFDQLRKNYIVRREAGNTTYFLSRPDNDLAEKLKIIGFNVAVLDKR